MLRLIPCLLCICVSVNAAFAQTAEGPKPLSGALRAAESQDWDKANALAHRAGGQIAVDLITWHRLREGKGSTEEVLEFLARRADWPGLDLLRKRSEEVVATGTEAQILAFFDGVAPQTGGGLLAYVNALMAAGRKGEAEAGLVLGWRTLPLDSADHAALLAKYDKLLAPHHAARLNMALWNSWEQNSTDMLPLVDEGWQRLAAARIGLREDAKGVDGLIAAVPAALADHPGLAYERFTWRLRKGRQDDAIALMIERSTSAETLGEPEEWARRRADLARRLMREGSVSKAYQLASQHGLSEGSAYADLEWLSGFLALRFQNKPERALAHFQRFEKAVFTPISLGRAGYWIGRAQEALDNKPAAQQAYAMGAQYQTTYYGLLAAEKAGAAFDPSLYGKETYDGWQQAGFAKSSVFQAAILLINAGELDLGERFLRHMTETLPEQEIYQLGDLLLSLERPHLAVMVGKQAAQRGLTVAKPYYPLHPLTGMKLAARPEMALSIARRESEFNPTVVSHAGAQGLMQVMPATAKLVAARLGVDHDPSEVLNNWRYNAVLGSAYLAQLGEEFAGNVVLVSAGYNAGPRRPARWIEENGDPRDPKVDVIDWVELIPFNETRNYVMRVSESLPIYRARLGMTPLPHPFSQELKGSSVLPLSP